MTRREEVRIPLAEPSIPLAITLLRHIDLGDKYFRVWGVLAKSAARLRIPEVRAAQKASAAIRVERKEIGPAASRGRSKAR
jgi:hypothetical protein